MFERLIFLIPPSGDRANNHRMQRSRRSGRFFEVNAYRAGPLMRVVTRLSQGNCTVFMKSILVLLVILIVGCGRSTERNVPMVACQEARLVIEGIVHGQRFQSISRIDPLLGTGYVGSTINYPNGEYRSWGYSVSSRAVKTDSGTDTHEIEWKLQSDGSTKRQGRLQLEFTGSKSEVIALDEVVNLYLLPPYEE